MYAYLATLCIVLCKCQSVIPNKTTDKKITHSYTRHIWLYDNSDYQSLSRDISETDWNSFKDNNVDIYATKVIERIMTLASKHIPNKTIRVRNSDPSWLSNSIKRLMRKRKRLFDKYKKSKSLLDFENYKHVRINLQMKYGSPKRLKSIT